MLGRNFLLAEFGTFLLVEPEPAVPWTNGGHSSIQRARKVQGTPLTIFLTVVVMVFEVGEV